MSKGKSFLAVLLCIPLLLIAFFAIKYRSQTVSDIISVSVQTPGSREEKYESEEDVGFFVSLLNNATPIGSPIRDINDEEPVDIIYLRTDKQIEYRLYPSLNLSGCMIEGPISSTGDAKFYNVSADDAKALLLRNEFSYLYSSLFLPKFTIKSGEKTYEVAPIEATWNYIKADSEAYEYVPEALAQGDEIYTVVKGLENLMYFEAAESSERCEMTEFSFVAENGTVFDIDNISELDLSVDTLITVSFKATWSSYGGVQSYGEARYSFNVLYDLPAVIELDNIEHKTGDIAVINAGHLNYREQASITSSLFEGEKSFSVTESDNGVALIPIPYTAKAQAYVLEIFNGAETQTCSFNVSRFENTSETLMISVNTEEHEQLLSVSGMEELESKTAEITSVFPEKNYFIFGEDKFLLPIGGKKTADRTFGQAVMLGVADGSTDLGARDILGEIYHAEKGSTVRSAQAGTVVYCGSLQPTGNTVIIYHGYGIFTHYYHLNEINVSEGQEVAAGEAIGTVGDTGFTAGATALQFGVSIGDTFINPEQLR